MSRRVLVTGGAGGMGRVVIARLRAAGMSVRAFDLPAVDFSGLEGQPGVEVARGDITRSEDLRRAVDGVDAVVHLAAILPPGAERNPALTFRVNVEGTRALIAAVESQSPKARFVFSSSVSVYGDTSHTVATSHMSGASSVNDASSANVASSAGAGVSVDHPIAPDDTYAKSKAESESVVRESATDWVVLRISGVAVPVFQEPPTEWPFLADQRVEFVHRDDAVTAIVTAVGLPGLQGRVFNVAGGATWRMKGSEYAGDYLELVGIDRAEAVYQPHAGHFDWYDAAPSQAALRYQNTRYDAYLAQIRGEVRRLMGHSSRS